MPDETTTALAALTSADTTDILPIVDDVGGTPITKKITYGNLVEAPIAAHVAVPDAHHARSHNHSVAGDGVDLAPEDLNVTKMLNLSGVVDYAMTGDMHNVVTTDAATLRMNTNGADRLVTGFAGGTTGRVILVLNTGTYGEVLRFGPEDGASTAANRIAESYGSLEFGVGTGTLFRYDGTLLRWRHAGYSANWAESADISTLAFGGAAAAGTSRETPPADHSHGMPALGTTTQPVGTAAGGAAATPSKSDHVHATGAGTPSTQAFGDAAATGSGPAAAMTNHKHAMPADPVTAHEAASDPHVGYLKEADIAAKGDLFAGTANDTVGIVTAGANDSILMADSAQAAGVKWVAPAVPVAIGTANAEGTSDDFARGAHVHAHETAHTAHDTLWDAKGDLAAGTGADAAAKVVVGGNGAVLVADSAQTPGMKWALTPIQRAAAPPGSPATGDLWYDTDIDLVFFYNGTRWLSLMKFDFVLGFSTGVAATDARQFMLPYPGRDKWLESAYLSFFVAAGGTALDASNKWVFDIQKFGPSSAATNIAAAAVTLSSGASDGVYRAAVTTVLDVLLGTTFHGIRSLATKTGTPGSLAMYGVGTCRLVGE